MMKTAYTIIGLIIGLVLHSCNTAKYVPDGKYLLVKNEIEAESNEFSKKEYLQFVRQSPNKKIFGFWRFHMGLYNLSDPGSQKGMHNWLRSIGEAPVLFDPFLAEKSKNQIGTFLYNKGYHHPSIQDSVVIQGYKARSLFLIDPGEPYLIGKMAWHSEDLIMDRRIADLIRSDSADFSVKAGDRFDLDKLQQERIKLTNRLKELGYYDFSKEYIYFEADTFAVEKLVNLRLGIKPPAGGTPENPLFHNQYRINQISVVGDFEPLEYMQSPSTYFLSSDTVRHNGLDFIFSKQLPVKKNLLHSSIYLKKGDLYKQSLVDKTSSTLNGLQNFRTINFRFEPLDSVGLDSVKLLDCRIELSPMISQSYDISLEGTHSSGNLGMAGNLVYNHRNLFRGAENFELKFRGAIEFLTNAKSDINQMIEFGVQTRLNVPQFWLPVRLEILQQKYTPRTNLTFDFNYQLRPEITRTIASAAYGYQWRSTKYINHQMNLIDLNYVNVTDMSDRFRELISGTYLEASYQSHVIPAFNYSVTFSNQEVSRQTDFFFIHFRPEIAGNVFSLVNRIAGVDRPDDGYLFFDTPYSQYFMADIDLRYSDVVNPASRMVYRLFAGAGIPYGNTGVMPFEKMYFSGGSNGIRAWQVRSLGPGSYVLPEGLEDQYPNQLGDIKLEANVEYRFDLFWQLKGAVFLDAGNIWTLRTDPDHPGADFQWNRFYKEIALGTGVGVRLDLSFVVVRLDLGMKLRDPGIAGGEGWLPFGRKIQWNDFMLNFGIGYPF